MFIDDVLIHGVTLEKHNSRLTAVLSKLREIGLRLNREKCQIAKTAVKYLGHTLSQEGLSPMHSKVQAVQEMRAPVNKQEVRRFLGFLTYLQKFCSNLAEVAASLCKLIRKDVMFTWEVAQSKAFEASKKLVTQAPTLKLFEPDKSVVLSVDASGTSLGAVLL